MPRIISIEGNIGSGKSTFIKYLSKVFNKSKVILVPEPVDQWDLIKDTNGKTMLHYFYEDPERNAFSFQMMAYVSRLVGLQKAIRENPDADVIITERCLGTDFNVFVKMLYQDGKIREIDYQIYTQWFNTLSNGLAPTHYLYIKATASTCAKRIEIRSRDGEQAIPLEYLEQCGFYHDTWLNTQKNVIVCNGELEGEIGYPKWISQLLSAGWGNT